MQIDEPLHDERSKAIRLLRASYSLDDALELSRNHKRRKVFALCGLPSMRTLQRSAQLL